MILELRKHGSIMQISVKSNVAQSQSVGRLRQQMPFPTSLALNDAAFAVRKEIVERTYLTAHCPQQALRWRISALRHKA